MRARARVDSFGGTTPASFCSSFYSKLRMVIGQNARRSHVKLKRSQVWILLYLLNELVSQSSRVRFAVNRNLPRRLIVCCDAHVGRRQAFKKMQQDFNWIVMRVNRRCERLPICLCRAHELGPRRVVRYTLVKPRYLNPQQAQIREQQQKKRAISATYPKES